MRRLNAAAIAFLWAIAMTTQAFAWGATGHEWIGGIAIEKLPESIPEFVRAPEAVAEIAVMGRELDRSKGAGKTHDAERDPGHYIDMTNEASVMGVLPLEQLPETREEYDTVLRAGGFTQYEAGYLPYSIVDGFQRLRKDFAYWRALTKAIETATTPDERAWFVRDMIVEAWEESADTPVGYPIINVRVIESGKVRATRELFGAD